MKKLSIILIGLLAGMLVLTSCGEDETQIDAVDVLELEADLTSEVSYEEVDNIVESGVQFADAQAAGRGYQASSDPYISCATVIWDAENKTITIDFGEEGCEGPWGRLRAGKIVITYNGVPWYQVGAERVTTFENFTIDGVLIEGTRTVSFSGLTENDNPIFSITLVDGKITFNDGTIVTRDASFTRTWFREANPADDYILRSGSASGITRRGEDYSVVIPEDSPNLYKRCRAIPLSGLKEITVGESSAVIDYGDGACDNLVEITFEGETIEKRIFPRRGR